MSGPSAAAAASAQSQTIWSWATIENLRQRENRVTGTMLTGLTAIGAAAWWAAYVAGYCLNPAIPVATTVAAGALAKFYAGEEESPVAVLTDHFPKACGLVRTIFKPEPTANDRGVWLGTGIDVRWSQFTDPRLAETIALLLNKLGMNSAYDFGCGGDGYSKVLKKHKIDCLGLDGNPELSGGTAELQDLTVPFNRGQRDCVISLEVGGKIPKDFEDQFIRNISDHAKKIIIISWPIPKQDGPHNKKNPRDNQYIIDKIEGLGAGWKHESISTQYLKEEAHPVYFWFQDTLLLFTKEAVDSSK